MFESLSIHLVHMTICALNASLLCPMFLLATSVFAWLPPV
jgi:hypothetical protein